MLDNPDIHDFYRTKLSSHGATAPGVGWKDSHSQEIRFQQLIRIIRADSAFSINDLGCGTGDLINLLESNFSGHYNYKGYDPLEEMISAARKQFPESDFRRFVKISDYGQMAICDYTVASGIFNVKNNIDPVLWQDYILSTISAMSAASTRGFAFNALTKYSDAGMMRPDLFYSDPLFLFDYCKKNFSKNVAILHDYGIYDFTILVRKDV